MTTKHRITASNFYEYTLCPRTIYLDIFGDADKKLPQTPYQEHLFEMGREFEKKAIANIGLEPVEVFFENDEEAFQDTLTRMKNGEELIYQGTLLADKYIGIPDLLEKVEGKSSLGDHYYRPVDIKMGKRLEEKYRLQVTFYAFLLEKVQGVLPKEGGLILQGQNKEYFSIEETQPLFEKVFKNIKEINNGQEEDLHIGSTCNDCGWKPACMGIALDKDDVSLVYNLQKRIKISLKEAGINTVKDLAETPLEKLLKIKFVGKKTAERLKLQARSLVENKVIKIGNPEFPKRKVEIFFDIEGESGLEVEYLFGLLVRQDGKEEYVKFVAEKPEEEKQLWLDFIEYMKQFDDFVMYHYHSYESTVLKRFTEKYETHEDVLVNMLANMKDLRTIVTNNLIFPIYKYSIKDIAKYIGFSWSNKEANAAQSMLWYSMWLETGDRKYLDLSIEYNEDDCKATRVVRDWVEEFCST